MGNKKQELKIFMKVAIYVLKELTPSRVKIYTNIHFAFCQVITQRTY